ncbi:MAG: methyltransferase domain-containing protein [Thaumarchaeota archaeon]|nr:MAG: methyltransferase domain-containing protein [Nitrososphaerota archaeon]TLX93892.1 MAG: methyltransferase domain-containing protein [Nitrososphaerota archaeon]
MKEESPKALVRQFFENTSSSYEKVVNLTTFGRDAHWKREIIKKISKCNSILDLACGTGILTFKIVAKFPEAKITGVDVTESYLRLARKKLQPYNKVSFVLQDAEKLDLDTKFDCITSSYIPKYCVPNTLLEKCFGHLNQGGKIILHDFTFPQNTVVRIFWNLYFVILKFAGYFVPSWKNVFENLPELIRTSNWVDEYKNIMERMGLQVEVQYLTLGSSAILTGRKKI